MKFSQLEYFCALCRTRSVTRAAEEMYVSQPTISIAIRNLESELRVQLINHGKNAVSLTAEGEQFYRKASEIVRRTQDLYTEFADLDSSAMPLRIGIPPLMSTIFFPLMTNEFHKTSDIPIRMYEYGSQRARALVMSEELDIALVNMDFYNIDQFASLLLMTDRYVYCVSKKHPLHNKTRVSIEDLKEENIILFNTDSVQNELILSRFLSRSITPNIIMHISQLQTIENCLLDGSCGAFLFSTVSLDENRFSRIEVDPMITSSFGLIWKKGTYVPLRTAAFIDFARTFDILEYR
jgi:DNA-binding transcriptional LysR family regulator